MTPRPHSPSLRFALFNGHRLSFSFHKAGRTEHGARYARGRRSREDPRGANAAARQPSQRGPDTLQVMCGGHDVSFRHPPLRIISRWPRLCTAAHPRRSAASFYCAAAAADAAAGKEMRSRKAKAHGDARRTGRDPSPWKTRTPFPLPTRISRPALIPSRLLRRPQAVSCRRVPGRSGAAQRVWSGGGRRAAPALSF